MSKQTNIVLKVLMILTVVAVAGAGGLVLFTHPFTDTSQPVVASDPEMVVDPILSLHASTFAGEKRNSDGTMSAFFSLGASQYLTSDPGVYKPIDTAVVKSAVHDVAFENTTNVSPTYFKNDVTSPDFISHVAPGNRGVAFTFVDGKQSTWNVQGNVATYPGVYDGMDARYTVSNDALLEELVVADQDAALNFGRISQKISVLGLYYRERPDGSITFHDSTTKNLVFVVPAPYMYEDNNRAAMDLHLHYETTDLGNNTIQIDKVIDAKGIQWLESATYPVVIDNSYIGGNQYSQAGELTRAIYSGPDTYALTTTFTNNPFGRTGTTSWGPPQSCSTCPSTYNIGRHYMTFWTGDVMQPGGGAFDDTQVVGAKLNLYLVRSGGAGQQELLGGSNLNAYVGPDKWNDFSTYTTQAQIQGLWNITGSMTLLPTINTTGLPRYDTNPCFLGSVNNAQCLRQLDIPLGALSLGAAGRTQVALDLVQPYNYYGIYYGIWSFVQVSTTASPYPSIEIIYFPKPTIIVDPAYGTSTSVMAVAITDNSTDETDWRVERSFTASTGPWTEICGRNIARTATSGTCGGAVTFDCTSTTKAGTGGTCTILDDITATAPNGHYHDRHVWYRVRTERDEAPGDYISSYSNVGEDYTLAAKIPKPPSAWFDSWDRIRLSFPDIYSFGVNEYLNQNSYGTVDPEPTKYCIGLTTIGVYPSFINASAGVRYTDYPTAAAVPSKYSWLFLRDGTANGLDLVNNIIGTAYPSTTGDGPRCNTFNNWIFNAGEFNAAGEYSANPRLKPGGYFLAGVYSQNTRDKTVNEPGTLPPAIVEVYTRARTPSAPALISSTYNSLTVRMDTTPSDPDNNDTGYNASPYVNTPWTVYAMQACTESATPGTCADAWRYMSPAGGAFAPGSAPALWGCDANSHSSCGATHWNGASGRTITGLNPGTCYLFRAQSANGNNPTLVGESTNAVTQWSKTNGKFCTPLATPNPPTVKCNYNDAGTTYYCDVTINDTTNPAGAHFYKIEHSYNGTTGWNYTPYGENWTSHSNGNKVTVTIPISNCATGQTTRYFRVSAAIDASGNGYNGTPSTVVSDTLPPCQPTGFFGWVTGSTSILWQWTAPASALAPNKSVVNNTTLGITETLQPANYDPFDLVYYQDETGLQPNMPYAARARLCDDYLLIGNPSDDRCGAYSTASSNVYTLAASPSIGVACSYDPVLDYYQCAVTLTEASPGNPNGTDYLIESCQGTTCATAGTWTTQCPPGVTCLPGNWFDKAWASSIAYTFKENPYTFLQCTLANTVQYYRVTVRNNSLVSNTPQKNTDNLPPCRPQTITHSNQTTTGLRWNWAVPVNNTQTPTVSYSGSTSGACVNNTPTNFSGIATLYRDQTGAQVNKQCTISVWALDGTITPRRGRAANGEPFYTSIQDVTSVTFPIAVTKSQITPQANPVGGGSFANLTGGSSGVQFQRTTGGALISGWINTSNPPQWPNSGLLPNRQYCYQAQSRNGDSDTNAYQPATPECRYTLAEVPVSPRLVRSEDGTQVRVSVNTNDTNPHGSGQPDTQYAGCITKYVNNVKVYSKYIRTDGTVDETGATCASGDGSGYWGTVTQWGGAAGISVTLDPSSKYDFELKARNGDGPIIQASGCSSGITCLETAFGPKATLFLVRNNVVGWAWSSNIGWLSLNCLNLYNLSGFGYSCGAAEDWGVNTNYEENRSVNPLGGYAWSASGQAIGAGICQGGVDNGKTCFSYSECAAPSVCQGQHEATTYDLPTTQGMFDFQYDTKTAGGPFVWALDSTWPNTAATDYLRKLNIATNPVTEVGNIPWNDSLTDMEFDKNGNIWIASFGLQKVYVVNPVNLSIISTINITGCVTSGGAPYNCNPAFIVSTDTGSNAGDMFIINQEEGDPEFKGSVSRIRISDYKEINCNGTDPGAGVASKCIVGRQPYNAYYDTVSDVVLVHNEYGASISRIIVGGASAGGIQTLSLPATYAYPYGGFARSGTNLYMTLTTTGGHQGYCSNNGTISCSDNTPCAPTGYCRNEGQYGNAAYVVINIDINKVVSFGPITEINQFFYPQGFAYDGQFLWMSDYFGIGTCKNNSSLFCKDDNDCGGTVGDCQNKQARAIQINESTGQIVSDYIIAPSSQSGMEIKLTDGSIWAGTVGGYLSKFPIELKKAGVPIGLGWVSLFEKVCSNNAQKGCSLDADCGGTNTCIESAGTAPDGGYGYCYTGGGVRYGNCSTTTTTVCLADTDCLSGEHCAYNSCHVTADCPNYDAGVEACRTFATANFNGITREVVGWGRIMTLKQEGLRQGLSDWGWLKLGGTYTDRTGATGRYTLTATEIDSQSFLGDPDVNPGNLKLYSIFGWGWNAQTTDYAAKSSWLPPVNITRTGRLKNFYKSAQASFAIDSLGDPHVAWSEYNAANNSNDIYYIRLQAGKWVTATGEEYQPGITNPVTSRLNVSNNVNGTFGGDPNGDGSVAPSLDLDANDTAHIVWQEGGWRDEFGRVVYSHWDPSVNAWAAAQAIDVDDSQVPSLAISQNGVLNVAYRRGGYSTVQTAVYFKKLVNNAWVSAAGDNDPAKFNVSHTNDSAPYQSLLEPHLAMFGETPHVVWRQGVDNGAGGLINGKHVFYRYWNGSNWVTASGDATPGYGGANISLNNDVGSIAGLAIPSPDGESPVVAVYSDGRPGVSWRDPGKVLYRRWNGSAWVSVSGQTDITNLVVNSGIAVGAEEGYIFSLAIDSSDRPSLAWGDDTWPMTEPEILYRQWNGSAWVSASGSNSTTINTTNIPPYLNLSLSATGDSQDSLVALDRFGNPHVIWRETTYSSTQCDYASECAGNAQYPQCVSHHWSAGTCSGGYCSNHPARTCTNDNACGPFNYCSAVDLNYSKWMPGVVSSGLGWVEFMPAGALLGIPWVKTAFSDIYAQQNIGLAPPPRGTGEYTATFLIMANGDIQGITGNYSTTQSGPPTSSLAEPGLDPLQTSAGYPVGRDALSRLDINSLVTRLPSSTKNKFGHEVVNCTAGSLTACASFGANPVLGGKVYYFNGNTTNPPTRSTISQVLTFMKGNAATSTTGNGLIVVDGDLEIDQNVFYDSTALGNISEMPSAAIIVRGNIYVSSLVNRLAGVFVALDNPATTAVEGNFNSGRLPPVTYPTAASADDTMVDSTNTNQPTATSISFGKTAGSVTQRGFLRFPITVPPGAEIKNAYLKLHGDGAGAGDYTARLYLVDADDARQPPTGSVDLTTNPNAVLYNSESTISISYPISNATWDVNGDNVTPNIKALVQKFIGREKYQSGYAIGIALKEGDAAVGEMRGFRTWDFYSANPPTDPDYPPQLVIEYAPQRATYSIDSQSGADYRDDTEAWLNVTPQQDYNTDCMNVGYYGSFAYRTYFRFAGINVPTEAEIIASRVRSQTCSGGPGNEGSGGKGFQFRQGLLQDYPGNFFTANPYTLPMDSAVTEIAQDITDPQWTNNEIVTFRDITTIVQSFIARIAPAYQPGVAGSSELTLRLRRGSDSNETTAGLNEYRGLVEHASYLDIDYRLPLHVSGLLVAKGFNFDRKYTKDLAAAEQIVYDGRVVANTPPGLSDFARALPVYQRVTP